MKYSSSEDLFNHADPPTYGLRGEVSLKAANSFKQVLQDSSFARRSHIQAPYGTSKEDLETLAFANEKAKPFVEGNQIVKVVVVPDRLVNIVVKST